MSPNRVHVILVVFDGKRGARIPRPFDVETTLPAANLRDAIESGILAAEAADDEKRRARRAKAREAAAGKAARDSARAAKAREAAAGKAARDSARAAKAREAAAGKAARDSARAAKAKARQAKAAERERKATERRRKAEERAREKMEREERKAFREWLKGTPAVGDPVIFQAVPKGRYRKGKVLAVVADGASGTKLKVQGDSGAHYYPVAQVWRRDIGRER